MSNRTADERLADYIERNLSAGYRFDPTLSLGWMGWTCYGQAGGYTSGDTIKDLERRLPEYLARLVRECPEDDIVESMDMQRSIWCTFYPEWRQWRADHGPAIAKYNEAYDAAWAEVEEEGHVAADAENGRVA